MIGSWSIENSVLVEDEDRMRARWKLYDLVIPLADRKKYWMEFGVHKGDTINYISRFCNIMFGFDSWEGLPEKWKEDFPEGTFSTGGVMPKVNGNVVLIKGLFQETLPKLLSVLPGKIGFIHIDSDLYESARFVLQELEPRIWFGTVIIFDELIGYKGYRCHEFKALKEFAYRNFDLYKVEVLAHTNFEQVAVILCDRRKADCEGYFLKILR